MKQMSEASAYVLLAWEGKNTRNSMVIVDVDCSTVQYFPLLMIRPWVSKFFFWRLLGQNEYVLATG